MPTAVIASIIRRETTAPPRQLSARDRAFADRALDALNCALAHPDFFARVRAAEYSSALWLSSVNTLTTLTGDEIAEIIAAAGDGSAEADGTIGLTIELTKLRAGILAFTDPRDPVNTIDSGFFDDCVARDDPPSLAALWMHEWMHSAGFQHRVRSGELSDVACTVERIVRELAGPRELPNGISTAEALPQRRVGTG